MRLAIGILGIVLGAAFGLLVCVASISLLGDGKSLAEAFVLFPGTPGGFQVSPDRQEIQFYYWMRGSAISDDPAKGFAYRLSPPARTVKTLDGIRTDSRDGFTAYRHIQGPWYLSYEFTPD